MKKLILFLMIEIGVVSIYAAKPRIHYGRCNVSGLGGYCVDERTCDLSGIDVQSWPVYSTSCKDIESSSTLLCCPTTKPPSRTIPSTPPRTTVTQPTRTFSRSTTELPLPPKCGTYLADKITGGTNTTLTEFPWMAVLRYTYDDVHFLNKCGGTLISERWVLTAAHCVHNQEALTGLKLHTVRLGEWDLNSAEDCINYKSGVQCVHHQDIEVSAVIPHPAYTGLGSRYVNDIALVKLKESAQFARNVEPICLPEPVSAQPYVDIDFAHRRMDISGWGLTEAGGSQSAVKLKATLTVWSPNDCTTSINEVARSYSRQTVNTQFCASGDAGQSSCRGDSGGPIMGEKYKNRNPYYYIYGIISYGVTAECSSNKYPVIFTRVDTFVTWIRNVIATDDR